MVTHRIRTAHPMNAPAWLVSSVLLVSPIMLTGFPGSLVGQEGPVAGQEVEMTLAPDKTLVQDVRPPRAASQKWIGVITRPVDPALVTHLGLEDGVGLIVEKVVDNSPAARAQIEPNDILLKANERDITSGRDIVDVANASDTSGFVLTRIHQGKRDSVQVLPEARPARSAIPWSDSTPDPQRLRDWIAQLERGNAGDAPVRFRLFNQQFPSLAYQPFHGSPFPKGNVSIRIQSEDDKPATIEVTKDGKTWEVTEDALDELPDELRSHVQALLKGGNATPLQMQPIESFSWPKFDRRMDELDNQLREMMDELKRMHEDEPENDALDA